MSAHFETAFVPAFLKSHDSRSCGIVKYIFFKENLYKLTLLFSQAVGVHCRLCISLTYVITLGLAARVGGFGWPL